MPGLAAPRVLSPRQLNRALLDRQQLLARAPAGQPIEAILEQVGGLQTQYAPAGYVGLWTRLAGFERSDLTRALETRRVVQATLLRGTIHLVSRRDFWRYALGVRRARRAWAARVAGLPPEPELRRQAATLREALDEGPRTVAELGDAARGFLGNAGLWVDLVRVPPSGTWERRRADRLALADSWVGPEDATEEEAQRHLVHAYLRGFGPAPWRDIAAWAGLPVATVRQAGGTMDLARFRDEAGRELLDVPGADIPAGDEPAPVRLLAHWDNSLLVHARRTGILPEEHRSRVFTSKNPFSVGTVLVDGHVAGAWSARDGRIEVEPYEAIPRAARDELEAERMALEAFHR